MPRKILWPAVFVSEVIERNCGCSSAEHLNDSSVFVSPPLIFPDALIVLLLFFSVNYAVIQSFYVQKNINLTCKVKTLHVM